MPMIYTKPVNARNYANYAEEVMQKAGRHKERRCNNEKGF